MIPTHQSMVVKSTTQATPSTYQPARRLTSTLTLTREQWLAVRMNGIGSSDAAAAVGMNPYKSQLELWLEKTGRLSPNHAKEVDQDQDPLYWGSLLENFVAAHYSKKTKQRVRRVNAVLQHPEHRWMLANLDREVVGSDAVQILECKTAGINGAKLWKEGVPEYVQLQVQHQMAVTGKQVADVAVLICGNEFRTYRIERDDHLIKHLISLEQLFWDYVESDTPPPADGSDSAGQALRMLYANETGETIDLREQSEADALFNELIAVRQQVIEQAEKEAMLKQKIQEMMGNASRATFTQGEVTWRQSKESYVVDSKRLQQDMPDIANNYLVKRQNPRRFLINSRTDPLTV